MEILLFTVFSGFCMSLASYNLGFCFEEGNILHSYYKWMGRMYDNGKRPYIKILGYCTVCNNPYISTIAFFVYWSPLFNIGIIYLPIYLICAFFGILFPNRIEYFLYK